MRTCQILWPMLSGFRGLRLAAILAFLFVPAVPSVCAQSDDREITEREHPATTLKTRAEAAWKSAMVCCNGKCYVRRGPYYIEEYSNVHTEYDNQVNPKEFTVVATVRVKNVRDGWSPPLPDQPIMRYRITQRSDDEWEFTEVADASADEISRIECDQLSFLGIAQCSCASSQYGVGTRNRTVPRKSTK